MLTADAKLHAATISRSNQGKVEIMAGLIGLEPGAQTFAASILVDAAEDLDVTGNPPGSAINARRGLPRDRCRCPQQVFRDADAMTWQLGDIDLARVSGLARDRRCRRR